ncbi:MAG: phosphate acyltransferase, partial [Bacteroidota bacterium]
MNLLEDVKESAKQLNKRIILPESIEERTLKAADHILKEGLAQIILLGSPDEIKRVASDYDLKNIKNATIIDPRNNEKKHIYIDLLVKAREHKGMTKEEAAEHVENPLCLTPLIIKNGDADGAVAGAENATRNVLRPAFQILKTRPGINIVSGAFFMTLKDKSFGDNGLLVFADCAVNPYPTEEQLAELVEALEAAEQISFDVETTALDKTTAELVGICLCVESPVGYYVPVGHLAPDSVKKGGGEQLSLFTDEVKLAEGQLPLQTVLEAVRPALTDPDIPKIAHNAKFDYTILD